jgi:hypothetical protein
MRSLVERASLQTAMAVTLALCVGCVTGRGAPERPVAVRDWGQTLAEAEVAAGDHRYAEADKLLADYSHLYPGTEGATESPYWRGLFALDPNNPDASPQVAAALFETYSSAGGALPHRREAEVLHRIALRLEAPQTTVASAGATLPAVAPSDRSADLKAKDTEIQRLKDELAKANDELERIKRRLTAPTKP